MYVGIKRIPNQDQFALTDSQTIRPLSLPSYVHLSDCFPKYFAVENPRYSQA